MPLDWIGDDDLRDRIVSGEAAIPTVWLSESNDEGGDVIEISRYGLPRGERDRYGRGRHLRPCSAGRPATKAPAASAGHDQVLNRFRFIPGADRGEVSGDRVALRAVPGSGEIGDRKSTRLNSSHLVISYAVFCLKKKKQTESQYTLQDQNHMN